ncbi:MAG TPA: riboflavin synthase [Burkholderiales bacterium]|nr:riboflavin synthase [Burkholderiales bacterium]
MFTGIIEAIGEVRAVDRRKDGARLVVSRLGEMAIGESIAVDGVCLTVAELAEGTFSAALSLETLNCTTGFSVGQAVNLERALKLSDRLGGHFVTGHVDGVAEVITVSDLGDNRVLTLRVARRLSPYLARKGSVALNGVSLTVNEVGAETFTVNLIPHTLKATALDSLRRGSRANVEVDLIARYVETLAQRSLRT